MTRYPVYRTPSFAVILPRGDFFENDTRVDARPAGRTRGEARRVRPLPRPAGSVA